MGKIFNGLNKEIMTAMKAGEKDKLNALKNLKAKLLAYKTSVEGAKVVNANNGEIPDINEVNVINKYVKELQGDIDIYKDVKPEMAQAAKIEMKYLEEYLPKAATDSEIESAINAWVVENHNITQRDMGVVVKYVKSHFDNVDGKKVANLVKARIK